jgi:hypothetical protein
VGAVRLIAATAPSFVLVDRLARCIGHHPVPRSASLRRPAAGLGRYAERLDPGPHVRFLEQHMPTDLEARSTVPCLRHQAGTPHWHSPLTIDHRPRPNWVAALRPALPQVTGAMYGGGTRTRGRTPVLCGQGEVQILAAEDRVYHGCGSPHCCEGASDLIGVVVWSGSGGRGCRGCG